MDRTSISFKDLRKPILIAAGLGFLYAPVLTKLSYDWWTDDNYSHGLIVPFIVVFIIWLDRDVLRAARQPPARWAGGALVAAAVLMLLTGTLASELFTQRISIVVIFAGVVVYFVGGAFLQKLTVPFLLLILAIPIPQILFNKIAFPLQIWASQVADWGMHLFGIPAVRQGNVIQIIPLGAVEMVGLEIVEACSGIRSLMTLVTLALILGYFTRERRENIGKGWLQMLGQPDHVRILLLMASAVPIALITNAARVTITGMLTYYYGPETAGGAWHEVSGSFVFISALILLILTNSALRKLSLGAIETPKATPAYTCKASAVTSRQTVVLFIAILVGGVFVNWFEQRGEIVPNRLPLREIPARLGSWRQDGGDIRFDRATEDVLKASDYVMRDYVGADGRWLNLYVGYYASQRSGATYHSPQNCLPGSGWEMKDPKLVTITTAGGSSVTVNRYIVQHGEYREILVYWYQGRGRTTPSEYMDKVFTSLDSVMRRRSDGAMVRIMTPVGDDEGAALKAALALTSEVADNITPFLPN